MSFIRTFIAISIPPTILTRISLIQADLKKYNCRISWVKTKNIHLTLKFLGETNEEMIDDISEMLSKATESISQFSVSIKETGVFPDYRRPRIIWVGAESDNDLLGKLASNIDDKMSCLGFKKENRRFNAHLTLGRVKDSQGIQPILKELKNNEDFKAGTFLVEGVSLIKSELHSTGAIYTPLRKISLI